eukprot:TRINITY_DN36_c0_g1_i4.p1 TRINITY_DN36_c0_g1~~TRINITY_DN36_c0_g1_i4.p1  ORF type:complete len:121 (+),score=34.94 TRINITY_DN36_c0_g1_i4:161-523(+)
MKAVIASVAALLAFSTPSLAVKTAAVQQSKIVSHEPAAEGSTEESPCNAQCRFDIMMCESFMCTKCTYEWCMEGCQKIQSDFPGMRCADWPEARTSYSNGDFAGKGKLGDGGDYAQKQEE